MKRQYKPTRRRSAARWSAIAAAAALGMMGGPVWAASFSFSSTVDWQSGSLLSTNVSPPPSTGDGHVRLNDAVLTPFNHIWVALSGRGTVARIDTNAAAGNYTAAAAGGPVVLGEYYTAPDGMGLNPSRTTVDANGDVWVGNRDQGANGSAAKISANPTGTTSSGVWNGSTFNALSWSNAGGADSNGGTSTAADSANLLYMRTPGINHVRAVAVDANNNVWVGGNNNFDTWNPRPHQLFDGSTGAPIAGAGNSFGVGYPARGGYGMLIDGNGVVWASGLETNTLVRHDPATNTTTNIDNGRYSYGLGIDNNGKIWVSNWTFNTVQRLDPATGAVEGTFNAYSGMRGVAVTPDNDVWVAASYSNGVMRMNNDGSVQTFIPTGDHPTGVAVDSNGKVWVTNLNDSTVVRIDPAASTDGAVDLRIDLGPGASPYNYSDMTGTVLKGSTSPSGSWTSQVLDGGPAGAKWAELYFNQQAEGAVPAGTGLQIQVRVADNEAGLGAASWIDVANSGDNLGLTGRYMQVRATLTRLGGTSVTPVLSDMQINYAPVPEPGTWAMMLGGLGLLGAMTRRRRSRGDRPTLPRRA
jgi:streptogramin lyase